MKFIARFALVAVFPLACATGESTPQLADSPIMGAGGSASDAGSGNPGVSGSGTVAGTASSSGGSGVAGTATTTAGTFGTAGTFASGGTFASSGAGGGSSAGTSSAGTSSGGSSAGKNAGGAAGSSSAGTSSGAGTGGAPPVTAYCDNQTKSPLPFTVNDGFQPSGWQGDIGAISAPTGVVPDACGARVANAVGVCTVWRFTPNAVTPAWAGVTWSTVWDAQYTHPAVCLASGATKVLFQARGAVGGEVVVFSAAGAAEVPFTLTNAWKQYSISLVGVEYNTPADGVESGFFWKVAPPTPGGGAVTFFIDDIKISK